MEESGACFSDEADILLKDLFSSNYESNMADMQQNEFNMEYYESMSTNETNTPNLQLSNYGNSTMTDTQLIDALLSTNESNMEDIQLQNKVNESNKADGHPLDESIEFNVAAEPPSDGLVLTDKSLEKRNDENLHSPACTKSQLFTGRDRFSTDSAVDLDDCFDSELVSQQRNESEQLRVSSAASLDSGTSDLCEISQNDNATKELFTIKTNEFTISVTTLDQNQTYNAKDIQTNEPIIENRRKTKNLKSYKKRRLDEDPRLKVCDICNRDVVDLYQHLDKHVNSIPEECELCDQSLNKGDVFFLRLSTTDTVFSCKSCCEFYCGKYPPEGKKLHLVHVWKQKAIDSFRNRKQTLEFTEAGLVKNSSHRFSCKLCEENFILERTLNHHIQTVHSPEETATIPPTKKVCELVENYKAPPKTLNRLISSITSKSRLARPKMLVSCDVCSKPFSTQYTLNRHKKVVDCKPPGPDMMEFACEFCDVCFASQPDLTAHKRNEHSNIDIC